MMAISSSGHELSLFRAGEGKQRQTLDAGTIIIFCICLTKCQIRLNVGLTCSDTALSLEGRIPAAVTVCIYTRLKDEEK